MVDITAGRVGRALETREATERKQEWKPSQLLPTPNPQPGWEFKYIRISLMGTNDPTNTSAMFREGWEPVKASEVPELQHQAGTDARYRDNVEIGGLLLCKASTEMVQARRDYYDKMTRSQLEAVDNNFMRQQDARMPLFAERRSSTTFGRGNK